jgi:predicted metal-dependent TIM-barrel fold hydrolase
MMRSHPQPDPAMATKIFEPHIHMFSRVTEDYEQMALCGIRAVLEPAFWLGQNRTSVGSFIDYFDTILGWERFRSAQWGIHHFVTMALNPREANDPRVNDGVLEILPRYLEKDTVIGVGEIGFDDQTDTEERIFRAQIDMARDHGLPLLIHTPHRNKMRGFQRTIDVLRDMDFPMEQALLDHGNEETIKITRDLGCWSGFSIYPNTKMTPQRMAAIVKEYGIERMIINSAADWGVSDPLMIPRTVVKMQQARIPQGEIDQLVWGNVLDFFGQSGRIDREALEWPAQANLRETYDGNSPLRGQDPDSI